MDKERVSLIIKYLLLALLGCIVIGIIIEYRVLTMLIFCFFWGWFIGKKIEGVL